MVPPPDERDPWDTGSAATPQSGGDLGLGDESGAEDDESLRTFHARERGRYARHGELGRGGMGRVLHARDGRLGREVALKELRAGRSARRLAREARITARLDHPGIVPVYDAGVGPDGTPFYTMGLVRGRSLGAVLGETEGLGARLALLRRVLEAAQAVAYAHSQGVVHRDLKPANIMLGGYGETRVVDWGLATLGDEATPGRRPAGPETLAPGVTADGAVLGTPAYMSPEQAAGERGDARADVWSLGIILYELVTGTPPFHAADSEAVLRRLRSETPPSPEGPRELRAIIERALHREKDQRYPDAGALAADLSSYIDGHEVGAYDYTPWELLVRLVHAWRVPVGVAAVAAVILAGTGAVLGARIADQRDRALDAERQSRAAKTAADQALGQALTSQAGAALQSGARARAEVLATHALTLDESPEARGVLAALMRQPRPRREDGGALPSCDRRLLGPHGRWLLCDAETGLSRWSGVPLAQDWERVVKTDLLLASDDGALVLRSGERFASLLDGASGDPIPGAAERFLPGKRGWTQRFSQDASILYSTSAQEPVSAHVLAATTERHSRPVSIEVCESLVGEPVVAPVEGARTAVLCEDGTLAMLDGLTPTTIWRGAVPERLGAPYSAVAIPGSDALVAGTLDGQLVEIDLNTGALRSATDLGRGIVSGVQASPDGATLAVQVERPGVLLWDRGAGTELLTLPAPRGAEARFEDERTVAVYTDRVTRWHLPADRLAAVLHAESGITSARLSPDGTRVATSEGNGTARLWSLPEGRLVHGLDLGPGVLKWAAFSPDGRSVALGGMNREGPILVDGHTGADERSLPGGDSALRRLAWMPGGRVLGLGYTTHPSIYAEGAPAVQQSTQTGWDLNRSASGEVVVSGESGITLFDGEQQRRVTADARGFVALSPDGQTIATTDGGELRLLDRTGAPMGTLRPGDARLQDVAFSPDGRWLAVGDLAGDIWIWRWPSRSLTARLRAHQARVATVDFSADGDILLSGSWDRTARLWDLTTLDADPEALRAGAAEAWGLDLDTVLDQEAR